MLTLALSTGKITGNFKRDIYFLQYAEQPFIISLCFSLQNVSVKIPWDLMDYFPVLSAFKGLIYLCTCMTQVCLPLVIVLFL